VGSKFLSHPYDLRRRWHHRFRPSHRPAVIPPHTHNICSKDLKPSLNPAHTPVAAI